MITYGSTTLTSYNSIVRTEVYYYKSTSATSLSGGSWSTTKPTWENGKYIWQKIRTVYEDGTHSESDPVNITGQQGATGTAAYSYKLNSSDSIIGKTKDGEYTIKKITFSATYKQGTGAVSAYGGRFKIESTTNGSTWKTEYTSSGNESSKEFTIPDDIIAIKCSLYQSDGTTVLLDIVTVPVVKDGVDAIGLRDSIPYYLASDKDTGVTRLTQGWTRYRPQLTAEKKYLWVYYVSRYSEGTTEPELIEIKNDIVSFENHGDESPVENCVIDIEPVQDLHGYDSPWPAGGGENKITATEYCGGLYNRQVGASLKITGESRVRYTQTNNVITISNDTTYFLSCLFATPLLPVGTYAVHFETSASNNGSSIYTATDDLTVLSIVENESGAKTVSKTITLEESARIAVALGTNGGEATITNLQVESGSTYTTWSPYENICPISGFSEANVVRTGKNLFDKTKTVRGYINDTNGALLNNSNPNVASDYIPVVPNQSYYIKSEQTRGSWGAWYDKDKNYISGIIGYVATNPDSVKVKTAPSNAYYMRLTVVYVVNGESYGNPDTFSVNYPSTDYDYHPYSGDIYPISWQSSAGTVYGGTLDVTNGTLTVDRAMVDLGTLNWINATDNRFYTTSLSSVIKKETDGMLWIQSSMFRTVSSLNIVYNSADAMWLSAQGNVSVSKIAGTTTELIAEITGQQLVYELAEPITYTLTPQEITMLTGQNHIFSDTGQTAISYYDSQTSTDPYVDYSATSTFEVAQSVSDAVGTLQAPYKEVEWVESTGKQYVYLDWKPPIKTWGFEIDFLSKNATGTSAGAWNETTNVNGYGNIFGVRSASGINNVQLSSYSNGLLRVGNGTNIATGFKTDHTRQTIKLHNSTITKTDGTTATITRVDEDSSKNYCNMTIFALYNDALRRRSTCSINEPSSTRIYSLKFYDGDTLTVDLVGAIRKADKVTGLYDKVSKHFYPAPGMLYGNDVGDIIIDDTITENLNKTDVKATVINKNRSRMWEANVPFSKLEDGQKITVTYSYGGIVGSVETTELVGWDDTSSNYDVYLKLVFPNGDKTEWIPCYYSNTSRLTTHYSAGTPITFTYHENLLQNATETAGGSAVVRGFFANASYYSNTSYTQYSNNVKAGANGVKYNTLIMQDGENTWSCLYSGAYKSTNTGKPAYTGGFMLGKVLYSSGSGAQTSNSSLDTYYNYKEGTITSTIYDAYPLDLRYSTNCATTLVAQRPVYLVGTVESDGLFHLDVSQWWTQTQPTYEDGKVYVYLGVAYSTYQLWLATENPAYVYYNNEFILYDKALTLQNIATLKDSLETQIDGKVETWCQKTNPALSWDATERPNHTGDLWYYTGESDNTYKNNTTYQYNGSTNTWAQYSANPDLFDKIDGKAAIYYGTTSSVTSAEEGDYLVDSTDGSSYRWDGSKWVKVTDYKTAIDNIEIGGRNLLLNSATEKTGASNVAQWMQWTISDSPLIANEDYMFSFDAKMSNSTDVFYIGFALNSSTQEIMKQEVLVTDTYKRYTYKVKTTKTNINSIIISNAKSYGHGNANNSTGVLNIKNIKLEKGNKATKWTPAPEDIENAIQSAQSKADEALTSANNKNKIYYSTSAPTGGTYIDGDTWFDIDDDNSVHIYNGSTKKWVKQQLGENAIADASISNAKIANATIQSAKIANLDGAKIVANTITANKLATDAIKSNNYSASSNTFSPYSVAGTFLDLATGNIYTPNFGVDSVNGGAYINGQVVASTGQIGDSAINYWQIGSHIDYNMNPSAAIIGHGTSFIQSGQWQISNNRINTQTYDSQNKITYLHHNSKYWDYGMQVPELDTSKSTYIDGVSNNWLYIRRSTSDSIPALENNWEYLFRVDKDGTIYENGVKLSEKYASIDGVSGAYLPRSGGTITGNLTVNGTLTATASKANALSHTLSINGQSWSGSANLTINTLGVAYGGTGKTTGKDAANYFLNSLDTGSSTPVDGDYYISQYVSGGTTTTTYHRRPMSALWLYVKSKLSAADIYVPKTGGTFTGAVHVEDEFYADSATLGNLIVNGNANFTNGLRATALNGGQAIYPVKGTQTSKTGNWTGNINVSALYDGLTIAYWLPYAPDGNASLNLTLNNGTTTGAINCYYSGTSRLTTHYGAGNTILLTYWSNANINGSSYTGWWAHSQYYSNDIVRQGINYAQFQADTGGIQNYSLFLRTVNDKYASIVTSAGTGTKTKSTLAFDLSRLYLYYCNNAIAVDGYTSTWYIKTSYPLADMRYSFNITSNAGLVGKKPVYLVFNAIQTGNGYHTLADNWWVQDLPTSVDNKLYMYLGMAYDWYRMDLELSHPIYYFENGSIQTYYDGYFAGRLSSSQITTALGFTPYNATNPNGYTTNKGTVTSVRVQASSPLQSSVSTAQGTTLDTTISFVNQNKNLVLASPSTGNAGAPTFRSLVADDIPSLAWSKITSGNDDLKAIEALTGTSGFLKKTAANTWTLDTNTYLTGITSSQVTTALGYTPYDATNPNGYTTNTGTVTKITAGSGLKINTNTSGGDITTTGTINHINSVTAQTTQGLYPIKIDAQGHISAYGSAVTSWALSNITGADDLKAIEALTGTSGFLKKTAANTWSLDTTSYVPTTRKVNGHALSSDVTVTKGDVGLGNVTNYQQITGIGQGANGSLRVWTGDPTSTSTDDYADIPITITAYEQSTVKKAVALDLSAAVGSTSKPVYFKADGKPYEIGYTIEKSVPSNAVFTDTTYTFDGTYNASTNKAATVSTVTNAINALDGGTIGTGGKGKTITSLSQSNGNVSATFADISITKSQISDFPTSMTPTAHTHDDRYYTESEIDNKFTALTNTTTQINNIKFYSGTCSAGKTYIGWIKIASVTMSSNNYIGENGYDIGIYRNYNSPAAESYNIKVNTGWDNASIVQLNGKAGTQIIEKFRLVKDNTNHIWYFEIYVNPTYSTHENLVNFRIQSWNNVELNLLNTVQTEADSDLQIVSTIDLKPQGIVSNSNFYGNLIGTADIANSVAWSNITSKPINFITNVGALNTNGWKTLGGRNTQSSIAISYASSNSATWNSGAFSSSIVFGCQDTKGMVDVGYTSPVVTFGGGSVSGSTDDAPKWYFKLNGTSGQSYTFPDASKTLAATDGSNASGSWGISITGNAATATSATSATKVGTSTIWLYANNNEINFGGTNTGTTLYIGYRAMDSRPIPTKFIFGSSTGTADLQAKTVYLGSGTTSYISNTQYTGNAATATKATQDSDGHQINTTYLKLAGGTMTGALNAKANQYEDAFAGALNMNNSNIYGVNSIYTADASDNSQKGIHFYRSTTTVDSLHAKAGILYFTPNRTLGQVGTSYTIYHTGNKPTKSDVGLGNVDNTADANKVVKGVSAVAGTSNAYRHVWFSDSATETSRNNDADFTYNPNTNDLKVPSVTGTTMNLSNWKIEQDSSTESLMFRYVG